jgi:ketosteroid isomerase-like protein
MSQENVEMVRRSLKDVDFFWSLLDEYVVWDLRHFATVDLDPVYVGREAVIDASRHYWGTWDDYEIDAEEILEVGPSVVVAVHERGRGRGSGAPFEQRWAQVWTFQRGKIVRWELFHDRTQALEAVGLSE